MKRHDCILFRVKEILDLHWIVSFSQHCIVRTVYNRRLKCWDISLFQNPFLIFLLPSCPVCTTPSQCWWNMYAELRPRWKIQYPKGERGRTEVPRKIDDNNEFQICYLTMPSVRPVSTFFVAVSSLDIFVALIFSAYFYLTIARSLETRQHGTLQ